MKTKTRLTKFHCLLTFCLAIVFILALANVPFAVPSVVTANVKAQDNATIDSDLLYGRKHCKSEWLDAYDAISEGIANRATTINLLSYGLSRGDFDEIYELYGKDHGNHYWIPNVVHITSTGGTVKTISFTYLNGLNDDLFNATVDEYLDLVAGVNSEYEIALILHDEMVRRVNYVTEAVNAHNAYGAIVEGEAVCEGYAEAYQYLLQRCGIMSYLVTGHSHGEGHEWNLVRLDNQYYYTDVTWDDPIGNVDSIYHAYFNITTERLSEDHEIDDPYHILPVCNRTDKMYHSMWITEQYDVDEIASRVNPVGNTAVVSVYFDGTTDDFSTWINENFFQIIKKTVFKNKEATGHYKTCGREHQIYILGKVVPATAVTLDVSELSMVLGAQKTLTAIVTPSDYCSDIPVWTSSNPTVVKVDANGKLKAVGIGGSVITVTAGSKTATCNVSVHQCEHAAKTQVPEKASTCTVMGNNAYEICDECGLFFNLTGDTLSAIPYLDLLPHELSTELTWVWADDDESAVAKSHCTQCENEIELKATITKNTIVEPTTTEEGQAEYTATVKINGVAYTDTKTVNLPKVSEPFSWQKLWDGIIDLTSFNGTVNGYVGLGIVCTGTIIVLILLVKLFKHR